MLPLSLNVIGIEDGIFLGGCTGFSGTIKHEPSDFIVSASTELAVFVHDRPVTTRYVRVQAVLPATLLLLVRIMYPPLYLVSSIVLRLCTSIHPVLVPIPHPGGMQALRAGPAKVLISS